ncbi:MAG: hypothetical protein OSJ35_01395 [Alistipes sp.]|nr:hypothetical protein [Alistipes sp.]
MRTISVLLVLFLAFAGAVPALQAQPACSSGREHPRSELLVYPTQEEAATAARTKTGTPTDNRYLQNLTEWTHESDTFGTTFTVPFSWINRQVILHLDSASAAYEVSVNGQRVAVDSDPALPAEFNLTRWAHEGRNTLEIKLKPAAETAPLESWRTDTQPSIGRAWVMTQPTLRIRDVLIRTKLNEANTANAEIGLVIKSEALNPRTSRIHYELLNPAGERITGGTQTITLDMRQEDTIRFLTAIPDTLLWAPEHPVSCTLQLKTQHEGRYVEYIELPVGFREIAVDRTGQMLLNETERQLRACEVSPEISTTEIAALREKGYNTLKLKAGTIRSGLYADCNRMGMLVIAQAPIDTSKSGPSRRKGGNPSNDPRWREHFIERTADSYHTSKRHPSVIAFGLAEDSANGICLYDSYLATKSFAESRPFIYPDGGGEWNNDPLKVDLSGK